MQLLRRGIMRMQISVIALICSFILKSKVKRQHNQPSFIFIFIFFLFLDTQQHTSLIRVHFVFTGKLKEYFHSYNDLQFKSS